MFKISLIFVATIICTSANTTNFTNVRAGCLITTFSEVSSIVKSCTNIVIQNLSVPAGKTLELDLQTGSSLTFKGTTTFGYGVAWEGPLIKIAGSKLTVSGIGSKLDGQGAHYWNGASGSATKKPKFFKIEATGGSHFSNINLLNCPVQCVSIQNSNHLNISDWNIDVSAGDKNALGHNTDGFDISDSDTVNIQNCVILNQDDCVAVDSGTNLFISGLHCSGGHGLSISVGQSKTDSNKNQLSNLHFKNCTVTNSRNGIHIKTHTDGAKGLIRNVTYSDIHLSKISRYGVNVQQDYKDGTSTKKPSGNIPIHGLTLTKVNGTMTGSESVPVYVLCGSNGCSGFNWSGVSITGASQKSSCNFKPTGFSC